MVSLYLRSWLDPGHGGNIQGGIEGSWRELWQLRKPFKVLKQRGRAVRNKRENNILYYEKSLTCNPANRWFLWHESKQNTIVLVVRTALLPFLSPHYHILLLFTHCLSPALPSTFWPLFPQFFDIPDHIQLVECVTILFLKATILPCSTLVSQ